MEWRAIIAVALSIFILIIWQYVFVPVRESPQPPVAPASQDKPVADTSTLPSTTTRPGVPSTPRVDDSPVQPAPLPQSLNERLHVASFTPSVTQLTLTTQQPQGTVRFEYEDPTGW